MAYRRKYRFGQANALRSGRFEARYKLDGTYRYAPFTFNELDEAYQWLDELHESMNRDRWRPGKGGLEPFRYWGERWRVLPKENGQPRAPKTLASYKGALDNHVYPIMGDWVSETINVDKIWQFQTALAETFKDGCKNKRCTALENGGVCRTRQYAEEMASYVLNYMERRGAIKESPYKDDEVFMPWLPNKNKRAATKLTKMHISQLVNEFHPHYRTAIMVAAYMGLRAGEVWALRRSSVDLDEAEMLIDRAVSEISGEGLVMGPPKGGRSRTLSIPANIVDLLGKHMAKVPGRSNDWLFPGVRGGQVRHSTFMDCFYQPALAAAGLPDTTIFHDLRHFCVRVHISDLSWDIHKIKELCGHSSIVVTSDIYGSWFDEDRREMAKQLDSVISAQNVAFKAMQVLKAGSRELVLPEG